MFGYIIVNKQELKFREFDCYQSYYCGLCQCLKKRYGRGGQLTLSYDMTFLIVLLSSLYEPKTESFRCKCIAHPFEAHPARQNVFTEYAADMNLLLTYYKCMDDWEDERKVSRRAFASILKKRCLAVCRKYPHKAEKIGSLLGQIRAYESAGETSMDLASGCFGESMAEVFAWRRDEWETELRKIGFFLGKFIYLMDAYEDMDQDSKNGSYNVFLFRKKEAESKEAFEADAHQVLQLMMAECSRAFEKLPILENVEILRNILYSGVWCRYEAARRKKEKENA